MNETPPTTRLDVRQLKILMAVANISTDMDLASRAGLTRNTISRGKRGYPITLDTLNSLAIALHVSPCDLLATRGHPEPTARIVSKL